MNVQKDDLLDLLIRPGFFVKDQKIAAVNSQAGALLLEPGMEIDSLLATGRTELAEFENGCLSLELKLGEQNVPATVTAADDGLVFVLDQDTPELRSLALAAKELREPLTGLMVCAQQLAALPDGKEQAARVNRGLHQLLRVVGNMSDAGRKDARMELQELCGLTREIFDRAKALTDSTGITLTYAGPEEKIYGLADGGLLERAVLNLLSNAIKFTPKGGTVAAKLARHGRRLYLTVTDSGSGIAENVRRNLFSRYLRQPGLEDSRYGIGLGLVLVRSAAARHGGTVLVDQPKGTRVTLTLAIRQDTGNVVRSPRLRVDYAGEQDHGLIELSDCLPPELYE